MPSMIIYYGTGQLPATVNFEAPTDGPAMFILSGTATTQGSAPCLTGITLELDNTPIGNSSVCWANSNNNHTVLLPTYIPVTLTTGMHQIDIYNMNVQTATDVNDVTQLILEY